jgi:6-phospho-3-hexuloisomerase
MRLMHLGFNVFVIGETITPALKVNDVMFAISGSGETTTTADSVAIAKKIGARIIALTSSPDSTIGKMSDVKVIVPGRVADGENVDYFSRQLLGIHEPLAPLGTLFELSSGIVLDSVVASLMKTLNIRESDAKSKHANVE